MFLLYHINIRIFHFYYYEWNIVNNYIQLLGQIQLKLTYVATQLRCSRPIGNLTQRPTKPNRFSVLQQPALGCWRWPHT